MTKITSQAGQTGDAEDISKLLERGRNLLDAGAAKTTVLDDVEKLYRQALAKAPDNEEAQLHLAGIIFKQADDKTDKEQRKDLYQQARDLAHKVLEKNPESLDAHYRIGCCAARMGQLIANASALIHINEAKSKMELLIKKEPHHPLAIEGRVVLASIYTRLPWPMKDLKKAEALTYEAAQLDPNLTYASEKLAVVYAERKKIAEARKELQRCLAIEQPTNRWDAERYNWPSARKLLNELTGS